MSDYCPCGCGQRVVDFGDAFNYAGHLSVQMRRIVANMSAFEPGDTIHIEVVFKDEYRVSFDTAKVKYRPGVPSYYPLMDALRYAANARVHLPTNEPTNDRPTGEH